MKILNNFINIQRLARNQIISKSELKDKKQIKNNSLKENTEYNDVLFQDKIKEILFLK